MWRELGRPRCHHPSSKSHLSSSLITADFLVWVWLVKPFLTSSYHTLWSPRCNRLRPGWCLAVVPGVSWSHAKDSRHSEHGAATRKKRRKGTKQHWYSWWEMDLTFTGNDPITNPKSGLSRLPQDLMHGSFLFYPSSTLVSAFHCPPNIGLISSFLCTLWKSPLPLATEKHMVVSVKCEYVHACWWYWVILTLLEKPSQLLLQWIIFI